MNPFINSSNSKTSPCSFHPVASHEQIESISRLAANIWREHYPSIISKQQIDHMLEKYQSADAIKAQLAEGYYYFLIQAETCEIGYLAIRIDQEASGETALFISKIYIDKAYRRQGAGNRAFRFIEQLAHDYAATSLWLTVNRNNRIAIDAYLRWGMAVSGALVTEIGDGYIMDDFRMEKPLAG